MISASIQDLWGEFQNLTAHQRRVVFHMYWEGRTINETAETMGIGHATVERALANAKLRLKNNLETVRGFSGPQALVPTREEGGTDKRGEGQVPTQAPKRGSVGIDRIAVSQSPRPDVYDGSPEREPFLDALNHVCSSAFLQLMGRGNYNRRACENRERVAANAHKEATFVALLNRGLRAKRAALAA